MRTRFPCLHGLPVVLFALSACAAPAQDGDDDEEAADRAPVRPWSTDEIAVCWENPAQQNAQARAWAQRAVEETWPAAAKRRLVGWRKCRAPELQPGIRIAIADERPQARASGEDLDRLPGGVVLNFTYRAWPRDPDDREWIAANLQASIEDHAIREFAARSPCPPSRRVRICGSRVALDLGFGRTVQVDQPLLEVLSDHLVHVHEHRHRLAHQVVLAVHPPGHRRPAGASRLDRNRCRRWRRTAPGTRGGAIRLGDVLSTMVILPLPTSLFPSQA